MDPLDNDESVHRVVVVVVVVVAAAALQALRSGGATGAFQGTFWWAIGITIAAAIPASRRDLA